MLSVMGLVGCVRDDRHEPAARQAGKDAYRASRELKQGAKQAAHELRSAGKQFREGWSEAKHDPPRPREGDRDRDKE